MLDVSVVVPFFNPAANLDECIESLLDQTLARERYEIVLVDDGSTDGSYLRAQRYADANQDLIRLVQIPASGWPGRPRNVGVDTAQGRYVQFVDSDDALDPRALARLIEVALDSDADVVVGKLTSDFRGLHHPVFRHTVTGRTIHDYPLVETLTPHKMVRRSLLSEHNIRFAEGRRHVEDEHFSMQVYTRATSVAVVGDLACYFYRRRRVAGRNLGDVEAAPADYYRDLAAVLDVVDDNVTDRVARIPLQRRFYRNEMLGRLRGNQMRDYPADFRRDVFDQVRDLAMTRFAPEVREGLGCFIRTQSRLLVDGDLGGLTSYAAWLSSIRLRATTARPAWQEGRLTIDIAAALFAGDDPLRLDREGDDWLVPNAVAPVPREDRLITVEDRHLADLDCATVSRADSQLWSTTDGLTLTITDSGEIEVTGQVTIDPLTLRGGSPLGAGLWDLRLRVMFGGMTTTSPLRPTGDPLPIECLLSGSASGPLPIQPYWTSPTPMLALDIGEWSHPLTDLIDDITEPTLKRRWLRLQVPAITGGPADLPAQLFLLPTDEGSPPVTVPAELTVLPVGANIDAKLPRRLPDGEWQVWARIGEPGTAAPRKLPWLLVRTKRRNEICSSGVHLEAASNSTADTLGEENR